MLTMIFGYLVTLAPRHVLVVLTYAQFGIFIIAEYFLVQTVMKQGYASVNSKYSYCNDIIIDNYKFNTLDKYFL